MPIRSSWTAILLVFGAALEAATAGKGHPLVELDAIHATEPRSAITYGTLHLSSRVTVLDRECSVGAIRENTTRASICMVCPRVQAAPVPVQESEPPTEEINSWVVLAGIVAVGIGGLMAAAWAADLGSGDPEKWRDG